MLQVYALRKDPTVMPWEEPDILGDLIAKHVTYLRTMSFYTCNMELEEVDIRKDFLHVMKDPGLRKFMSLIRRTP